MAARQRFELLFLAFSVFATSLAFAADAFANMSAFHLGVTGMLARGWSNGRTAFCHDRMPATCEHFLNLFSAYFMRAPFLAGLANAFAEVVTRQLGSARLVTAWWGVATACVRFVAAIQLFLHHFFALTVLPFLLA